MGVRCEGFPVNNEIRLSEYLKLPQNRNGHRLSFGSLQHAVLNQECKVCSFYRKRAGKKEATCRHGSLCDYCHCEHPPYIRPRALNKLARQNGQLAEAAKAIEKKVALH